MNASTTPHRRPRPHLLRRALSVLCVLVLGLGLMLATLPDPAAAAPDHHGAQMLACDDCPPEHHPDDTPLPIPGCHHALCAALATLPAGAALPSGSAHRVRHGPPDAETGTHRSPDRDLPPPRA